MIGGIILYTSDSGHRIIITFIIYENSEMAIWGTIGLSKG